MWQFLIVGSLGAVGLAMAVGTAAALVRYYRTGSWPGHDETVEVSTGRLVGLYLRIIVGAVVATYAVMSLTDAGLL